jgi:hypothetical protein
VGRAQRSTTTAGAASRESGARCCRTGAASRGMMAAKLHRCGQTLMYDTWHAVGALTRKVFIGAAGDDHRP